jgi:Flp pilus assembly protein TadD
LQQALYIDPFGVAIHEALAEVCMMTGDTATALKEFTMLTRIEPDKARHFERAAMAAHKLGDAAAAEQFARKAVSLDPQSPAKTLIP